MSLRAEVKTVEEVRTEKLDRMKVIIKRIEAVAEERSTATAGFKVEIADLKKELRVLAYENEEQLELNIPAEGTITKATRIYKDGSGQTVRQGMEVVVRQPKKGRSYNLKSGGA